MNSAITLTDGYKIGHKWQYPEGTSLVYSNFTPRKTRRKESEGVVFFGLQYFIKRFLIKEFGEWFALNEDVAVNRYARRINHYLPPNHGVTFDHIRALHRLQYVPVVIKALPEGSVVPYRVAPLTIVNTLPEFFWITNYLETILSCELWLPCTSATTAHQYRKILKLWADKTGGDTSFIDFQGHDFSMRGIAGVDAAAASGAAHLLSFKGTDTLPAIDWLEHYYNADCEKEFIGGSIPATEHSVMCMGMKDGEEETFRRLIEDVYPSGPIAAVSDTWDLWSVLTKILPSLKSLILSRDGKLIIRPDSGDPVDIICGRLKPSPKSAIDDTIGSILVGGVYYKDNGFTNNHRWEPGHVVDKNPRPEDKGVVELLWDIFGGTVNEKGFKVLDSHIGAIYGDSITLDRADQICQRLSDKGFASTNIVLGIGSYTYQYVTRDTDGWAMKATYGELTSFPEGEAEVCHHGCVGSPSDGTYCPMTEENCWMQTPMIECREIFKDPITDDGTKKSAKGLLRVRETVEADSYGNLHHSGYIMDDQRSWEEEREGALEVVFKDGKLLKEWSLQQIRERLK